MKVYNQLKVKTAGMQRRKGPQLEINFRGRVIDVGMRYQIWRVCKHMNAMGHVYNQNGIVRVLVAVNAEDEPDLCLRFGEIAAIHSAVYEIESRREVEIEHQRRFVIRREYKNPYSLGHRPKEKDKN